MAFGLAFHGVTAPKTTRRNRYPAKEIASRIEAARIDAGMSVKEASDLIGLEATSWYKKAQGVTPFKVIEAGIFAEHIKAPTGWPFVDPTVGLLLDRLAAQKDPEGKP